MPDAWVNDAITRKESNHVLLNAKLKKAMEEIEAKLLKSEISGQVLTPMLVNALVKKPAHTNDFLQYADTVLETDIKKQRATATYKRHKTEYKHLVAYSGGKLSFYDITPAFLTRYHRHLLNEGKDYNTTISAFKFIRLIFNHARAVGDTQLYPFAEWKSPRYINKPRGYLIDDELTAIRELLDKPLDNTLRSVIAFFLLECYAGIRHSDWGKFNIESISDNVNMTLHTTKTGARVTIPVDIYKSLKWVIDYITEHGIIFNLSLQKTNVYLKSMAAMAGIKKHITTHTGRHTFAVRMLEKGCSNELIAELMGISMKVVNIYAKYTTGKARTEFLRIGDL